MNIYDFFAGQYYCSSDVKNKEKLLNIFLNGNIGCRHFRIDVGKVTFTCTPLQYKKLAVICEENAIALELYDKKGFAETVSKYKHRYGVPAGILICIMTVCFSSNILWDIRINGCENVSEEYVYGLLNEQGLSIGRYLPGFDVDVAENRLLMATDDISWVAVNIDGNVAYVEVRETRNTGKTTDHTKYANVVAACDGYVESVEAYNGKSCVKSGQYVRKGDILISGVIDSAVEGCRYVEAKGRVSARTNECIHIEMPLTYDKKVPTGKQIKQNSIIFFSKEIKLYGNSGLSDAKYDTIYKVKDITMPDGTVLPVKLKKCTCEFYNDVPTERTYDETVTAAYGLLEEKINELTRDGITVLRKNTVCVPGESGCILECNLTLMKNIAEESEFEVTEQ